MKKLKIGIIGIGRLGYEHACNIANRVPGSELVAISDKNIARAKEVAEELGVSAVYENPADLCNDPNVEAVAIVTNTNSHVDMIELAMNAGKHVFCDKPLDTTIAKCKVAEKAVEAHPDRVFMLGFMRRFDESYAEAKRRIAAGSGTKVEDVNKLLKQFEMMQKMMKQFKKSPKGFARRLGGMMGNPNAFRGLK